MKDWLTAQEIADARLPSLPTTKRGVNELADREQWNLDTGRARRRAGRGGGMEYSLACLPLLAQVSYRKAHIRIGSTGMPAAANDAPPVNTPGANLSNRAALERDARLAVLRAFDAFAAGARLNKTATRAMFVVRYNAGSLQIHDWVRECVPSVSVRTLARWRDEAKDDANKLAVDKSANRKGKGVFDLAQEGRLRVFVLALVADNMHLSAKQIRKLCLDEFGKTITVSGRAIAMPPIRTFQHALKTLRTVEKVVLTKIQNPDLFRSTMEPVGQGVYRDITEPNQLWQIDASPVDALCLDGRHVVYACIDIATRRVVLHISKTARSSAVMLLMRKAILLWGTPLAIKTDNGSDFVSQDSQRLFSHLGIELIRSERYSPQEKGHVERVIRTFQHDCGTTLPGFVGHSVADRKAIEARKAFAQRLGEKDEKAFGVELDGVSLQSAAERWAEHVYHHEEHEGLGRRTPFQVAAASRSKVRTVDERALDILLLTVAGKGGIRTTTKHGIRTGDRFYMTPTILPGRQVLVRMDDTDLGLVYAFAADGGEFLGCGICPDLSGIAPETAVRAMKAAQREIVERGTAAIKAEIRRLKKGPSYFERIIRQAVSETPNVVALPKRTEAHTTPQIEAAIAAMEARPASGPAGTDPTIADAQRQLIADMEAEDAERNRAAIDRMVEAREAEVERERVAHLPATVTALPETPKARYRAAVALEQRIAAGEDVSPIDVLRLGRYRTTAEFRGEASMHADFGDAYLAL